MIQHFVRTLRTKVKVLKINGKIKGAHHTPTSFQPFLTFEVCVISYESEFWCSGEVFLRKQLLKISLKISFLIN